MSLLLNSRLALHKRSGDDGLADRPGPLANRQEIHSSALPISTSTVVQKSGLATGPLGDDLLRRLWLHRRTAGTRHTRGKLGLRLELDLIAGNLARVDRPYLIPIILLMITNEMSSPLTFPSDISWGFPVWVLSVPVISGLPFCSKVAGATDRFMIVPVKLSPEALNAKIRSDCDPDGLVI